MARPGSKRPRQRRPNPAIRGVLVSSERPSQPLAVPSELLGLRDWARTRYTPRTAAGEILQRHVASDPLTDRIASVNTFNVWLRHGPRMPARVCAEAPALWKGYTAWRRVRGGR